jgi:hypothetical protein
MSDHKQNLTDLAAMFAMMGLIRDNDGFYVGGLAEEAYDIAEEMMMVREERMNHSEPDEDEGIAAIKPKRTRRSVK